MKMITQITSVIVCFVITGCSAMHRVNGWYSVADEPENKIEGKPIITVRDFDEVYLDTVSSPGMVMIGGRIKAAKVQKWADFTESRIGKRIGFVYNDSVIMAPTINCRIESGNFTINSPDKALARDIYNHILLEKKKGSLNNHPLQPENPIHKIVAFASEVFLYGETTHITYCKDNQIFCKLQNINGRILKNILMRYNFLS